MRQLHVNQIRLHAAKISQSLCNISLRHWRSQGFVLRGPDNAEFETPKALSAEGNGEGYPPPQPTRGLGERRKLPQRGPGRSLGRKRILVHVELEKNEYGDDKFDIFCHFYRAYLESNLQG